jgi:hypothetical protein
LDLCASSRSAILGKIRPEPARKAITAAEALRAAGRVCGKTTGRRALTLDDGGSITNPNSPTIAHKAHSGGSPIIGR